MEKLERQAAEETLDRGGKGHLKGLRKNSGPGKDRQGLKPGILWLVYGPTKVVP
jgi:hypothetical protein